MASVLPAVNKNFYLSAKTLQSENRHARAIKGCEIGINVFYAYFCKNRSKRRKNSRDKRKNKPQHNLCFSLFRAASRALKKSDIFSISHESVRQKSVFRI